MRSHYSLLTCVTKPRQESSLSRLPTREQPGGCLSSGSGGKRAGHCALCLTRFLPKQPLLHAPETTISCRLNPMATARHVTARDAIDLVTATVDARFGIRERGILGLHLVDGRAPSRGVVFTEDVVKIADEQGRYAVGHNRISLGLH